jgi:chemotaxis protein CheD
MEYDVLRRHRRPRKEAKMGFQDETVAFGGIAVAAKGSSLSAPPIGSGVIVVVYDPDAQVGGMAHMPYPERPAKVGSNCDHRIESLMQLVFASGASQDRLKSMVIGGAEHKDSGASELIAGLASRSVRGAKTDLNQAGILEVSEEIGGQFGRTCELNLSTGKLCVASGDGRETVYVWGAR